jgi:hypothetical protein
MRGQIARAAMKRRRVAVPLSIAAMACARGISTPHPVPATPTLVLEPAAACVPTQTHACPPPTRLTILLHHPRGLATPDSIQVLLEPERTRGWGAEPRVRRGRFRSLGIPERAGAAFDSVAPGAYRVRFDAASESVVWRVVLARGCWSRLEVWIDPRAGAGALSPNTASFHSCRGAS